MKKKYHIITYRWEYDNMHIEHGVISENDDGKFLIWRSDIPLDSIKLDAEQADDWINSDNNIFYKVTNKREAEEFIFLNSI